MSPPQRTTPRAPVLALLGGMLVAGSAHFILVFPIGFLLLIAGFTAGWQAFVRATSWRQGLWCGVLFGAATVGGTFYWIGDVLYVLTPLERLGGVIVVVGFLGLVMLPYVLFGVVAGWLSPRLRRGLFYAYPPLLVALQTLIQDRWIEFPWLQYGYWMSSGPLGGVLALVGARWAGLVPLYAALLVACRGKLPYAPWAALGLGGACVMGWIGVRLHPGPAPAPPPRRIAVVAVNQRSTADSAVDDMTLWARYLEATRTSQAADWVVWPESVIRSGAPGIASLQALLGPAPKQLLAGALLRTPAGTRNVLVDMRRGQPRYDKQKLVPFSEYVPLGLRRVFQALHFNTLNNDVIAGPPQPPLMIDGIAVTPLICYEAAFSELVHPSGKPALLLNLSNEGWFPSAIMHRLSLAMALSRAREYGVPLVRAVVGGYSGFYDPNSDSSPGDASWSLPQTDGQPAVVRLERTMTARPPTTLYGQLIR